MELTPQVDGVCQKLFEEVKTFGDVSIEEKKTSFHIKHRAGFAGIHPRKDYLYLEIVSEKPIKSPRVLKSEQVSKIRFHNQIKIERLEDLDGELLTWLKEAHALMS